jgi:DNA-binding NtrC family response regulator
VRSLQFPLNLTRKGVIWRIRPLPALILRDTGYHSSALPHFTENVSKVAASRIFFVVDEPVIASALVAILKMNGFSAWAFSGPLKALAAAWWETPDLLISDVVMAELSGIELAIRMKALHPRCKVLLRSGHAGTLELLCDDRHRGNHFRLLLKPIFPTEMLSEINKTEDVSQPKGGLHLIR